MNYTRFLLGLSLAIESATLVCMYLGTTPNAARRPKAPKATYITPRIPTATRERAAHQGRANAFSTHGFSGHFTQAATARHTPNHTMPLRVADPITRLLCSLALQQPDQHHLLATGDQFPHLHITLHPAPHTTIHSPHPALLSTPRQRLHYA